MSEQERSEAARAMGRARTPAKIEAAKENIAKARKAHWSDPAARERHSAAMKEWHRRRKEQQAQD